LNAKEQQRLMVLNQLIGGELTGQGAATLMEVSVRQVRRLLAAYRKEGAAALAHGNRGRAPAHALPAAVKARIVEAAQTAYAGCNWAHLRDLLAEQEALSVSRSSVWRVLTAVGMKAPHRRRRPQHRFRRSGCPRKGCSSRWMAVATRGWRTGARCLRCCLPSTMPPESHRTPSSGSRRTRKATSCCSRASSSGVASPGHLYRPPRRLPPTTHRRPQRASRDGPRGARRPGSQANAVRSRPPGAWHHTRVRPQP
jgi:transposase